MRPLPMFDDAQETGQPRRRCRDAKRDYSLVQVAPGVPACRFCDGGTSWGR